MLALPGVQDREQTPPWLFPLPVTADTEPVCGVIKCHKYFILCRYSGKNCPGICIIDVTIRARLQHLATALQRLLHIGEEVIGILNPCRIPDQGIPYAQALTLLGGQFIIGHQGRLFD
jgi:hypothetical protein